jgi:hypothetical protein
VFECIIRQRRDWLFEFINDRDRTFEFLQLSGVAATKYFAKYIHDVYLDIGSDMVVNYHALIDKSINARPENYEISAEKTI